MSTIISQIYDDISLTPRHLYYSHWLKAFEPVKQQNTDLNKTRTQSFCSA